MKLVAGGVLEGVLINDKIENFCNFVKYFPKT